MLKERICILKNKYLYGKIILYEKIIQIIKIFSWIVLPSSSLTNTYNIRRIFSSSSIAYKDSGNVRMLINSGIIYNIF